MFIDRKFLKEPLSPEAFDLHFWTDSEGTRTFPFLAPFGKRSSNIARLATASTRRKERLVVKKSHLHEA